MFGTRSRKKRIELSRGVITDGRAVFVTDRSKFDYASWRGKNSTLCPTDMDLSGPHAVDILAKGMPPGPIIGKGDNIVAFGSCFAEHVSNYLFDRGYNVATKSDSIAYIARMNDGIVNTYAVLGQLEWAWNAKRPIGDLWIGHRGRELGYDEDVRLATVAMLDETDVFIITLGLSEIWLDAKTDEVMWRIPPASKFDPERHTFHVATQTENRDNLLSIADLIWSHRPQAKIILTLSPVPLAATFRPMSCMAANSVSKANLRSAVDEIMQTLNDPRLTYFPSYEMVLSCFHYQFMEDRRHVHRHIIDFIMAMFERHYCGAGIDVLAAYNSAKTNDRIVGERGHWAVPRANLQDVKDPH